MTENTRVIFKAIPEYMHRVHGHRVTMHTLRRCRALRKGPEFFSERGRLFAWSDELDRWARRRAWRRLQLPPLPAAQLAQAMEWRRQGIRWRFVVRPDGTCWLVPEKPEP